MTTLIAQISDTHLSDAKPFFVANFALVCEALNAAQPTLVVNTGDMALNGYHEPGDLDAAQRLHRQIAALLKVIPGNHDVGDSHDVPNSEHPIATVQRQRFVERFGPGWWTMDVPGWRLLGIDCQLLGSGLPEDAEQCRFISEAADSAGDRSLALFTHKPLCERSLAESMVGGRFLNPEPRADLLGLLGERPPALVVSGHVHQYRSRTIDGSVHVWGPSSGFVLPDELQPVYGTKEVGWVAHRLHADGTHEAEFRPAAGTERLVITDFPQAYDQAEMRRSLRARMAAERA